MDRTLIRRILGGAFFTLVLTLLIAALQFYGVISANLGALLLLSAWLVGVLGVVFSTILWEREVRTQIFVDVIFGIIWALALSSLNSWARSHGALVREHARDTGRFDPGEVPAPKKMLEPAREPKSTEHPKQRGEEDAVPHHGKVTAAMYDQTFALADEIDAWVKIHPRPPLSQDSTTPNARDQFDNPEAQQLRQVFSSRVAALIPRLKQCSADTKSLDDFDTKTEINPEFAGEYLRKSARSIPKGDTACRLDPLTSDPEESDRYSLQIGESTYGWTKDQLQGGQYTTVFGDKGSQIKIYLIGNRLNADIDFVYAALHGGAITYKQNELTIPDGSGWDTNRSRNAVEVVLDGLPFLQVIHKSNHVLVINGLFPDPKQGPYGLTLYAEGSSQMLKLDPRTGFSKVPDIAPIFRYPAYQHEGEYKSN